MADATGPPALISRVPSERRQSVREDLPSPNTTPRTSRNNSSNLGRLSRTHSNRNVIPYLTEGGNASPSLPADDGMRALRERIHQIRELAISAEEKASRMHTLMMEGWKGKGGQIGTMTPPTHMNIPTNRPMTPQSLLSTSSQDAISPLSMGSFEKANIFNVQPTDLIPSYRPNNASSIPQLETPPSSPHTDDEPVEDSEELGCAHYKRNVKIQCFDCKKWYPCRHCHDEADPSHALNRVKTENMLCMLCGTPQPAGQTCRDCGMKTAHYYCNLCKLWDDDSTKRIYHCNDCGICRRGEGLGKDYVHCKKCNVCISIQFAGTHRCVERATDCDCPICGDYMFTSSADIVAMPCGHYLHHTCYLAYIEHAYKCPICCKSAVNMEVQWRKLESAIESQPMPTQLRDARVEIKCNDCAARSVVSYHWLGNKCGTCDGYNTNEMRMLGVDGVDGREVEEYAEGERRVAREHVDAEVLIAADVLEPHPTHQLPLRPRTQLLQPSDYFAANFDDDDRRRRASHSGELLSNGTTAEAVGPANLASLVSMPNVNLPNVNLPNFVSPYEMLARMSRSLSPIRHYFDAEGREVIEPAAVPGAQSSEHDEISLTERLQLRAGHAARFFNLRRARSADALAPLNLPADSSTDTTIQRDSVNESNRGRTSNSISPDDGTQRPAARSISDTLSLQNLNLWRPSLPSLDAQRPWFFSPTSPSFPAFLRGRLGTPDGSQSPSQAVGSPSAQARADASVTTMDALDDVGSEGEQGSYVSDDYDGYGHSDDDDDEDDDSDEECPRSFRLVGRAEVDEGNDSEEEEAARSRLGLILRGHR